MLLLPEKDSPAHGGTLRLALLVKVSAEREVTVTLAGMIAYNLRYTISDEIRDKEVTGMAMNLWDFLQWQCSAMLTMERDIWQLNNMMMREVRHPQLKEAFEHHGGPTRQQISYLEQIIDRLGGIVGPEENAVSQGLLRAHHQFMGQSPTQEFIDLHHAVVGNDVEQLEISGYQSLLAISNQLGTDEMAQLLKRSMHGEENMRAILENLLPELLSLADVRPMKKAA